MDNDDVEILDDTTSIIDRAQSINRSLVVLARRGTGVLSHVLFARGDARAIFELAVKLCADLSVEPSQLRADFARALKDHAE